MTIEQIKSLLARFYEGQTTPEEERLLADFFRREDVEIATFVNNLGKSDIQPLTHVSQQRKGVIYRLKTPPKMFYRVAATVAILLAIGGGVFFHQQTYTTDPFRDTCKTPEEAAAELHKANAMITKASQQCLAPTRNAFEQVEDTKEIINKHITF